MSKSKNYKVYNGKKLKSIYENSRIYLLVLLFAIGIIVGSININRNNIITDDLKLIVDSFTDLRAGQGISGIFFNSFLMNGIFVLINLFLAFSLIGYPLILFIPFLKGLGIGALSGYLYSSFGFLGLGYSLLIIYPGAVVSAFALVNACNDSCEYSKNSFNKSILGKGVFEKNETKIMLIRQLVFIGVTALSSLTDALVSIGFSRFFEI